jgi:hypothetical protein
MTPSGTEPATFRLVEQLRHRVPRHGLCFCKSCSQDPHSVTKATGLQDIASPAPTQDRRTICYDKPVLPYNKSCVDVICSELMRH